MDPVLRNVTTFQLLLTQCTNFCMFSSRIYCSSITTYQTPALDVAWITSMQELWMKMRAVVLKDVPQNLLNTITGLWVIL